MADLYDRWQEILKEVKADDSLSEYLDDVLNENMSSGYAASRNSMSRTGTGGDPLRGRGSWAYDDISDDEKTLGEAEDIDPIDEALASLHRPLKEDDELHKRKVSAINTIRNQLEHVWQMLGKAETKLGAAGFKADEVDFLGIEKTIETLVDNVQDVMDRIVATRDKVSL
jgi:hypothetical protein